MMSVPNNMLPCQIVCHVCCKGFERNNFRHVFSGEGLSDKLSEKICKYTPFTVNSDSHSSAVICITCVENMKSWDNFIQSCIEAHLALKEKTVWKKKTDETSEALNAKETVVCFSYPEQHSSNTQQISETNMIDVCKTEYKEKTSQKSRNTYCIAKWCNNNTGESSVSFFRIPKDRQRAEQWLVNAGRDDLLDKEMKILHSKYLCETHFSETMFMNKKHKRLVWNATPSIFHDINSSICSSTNEVSVFPEDKQSNKILYNVIHETSSENKFCLCEKKS